MLLYRSYGCTICINMILSSHSSGDVWMNVWIIMSYGVIRTLNILYLHIEDTTKINYKNVWKVMQQYIVLQSRMFAHCKRIK